MNGKYGGTTITMKELPVGTLFYVCNGSWDGSIIEKDGIKCIAIECDENSLIKLTGRNENYILDINIKR